MIEPDELSNYQAELWFLLKTSQPQWARLEQIYEKLGTLAPKELVISLAKHILAGWSVGITTDSSLELNCLTHFAALGCELKPEQLAHLDELSKQNGLTATFFPKPLTWSPHALLTNDPTPCMDAPIVTAWIYTENELPREVVISGIGSGWIRHELDYAILVASMARKPKQADIMVEGFTRLVLEQEEIGKPDELYTGLAELLGSIAGSAAVAQLLGKSDKPVAMLFKLIDRLEQLSKATGLVQVFRRPYERAREFFTILSEKQEEAARLIKPEVQIWQPDQSGEQRFLVPLPMPDLTVEFSANIIDNPAYQELHDLYQNETIRVAAVDALRRINFYTAQLVQHSESLKLYLDPKTRKTLPDPEILTHRIDYATGLMYRLNPPEKVSRDEYYGVNVPQLIKKDIEWTMEMRDLIKNIGGAVSTTDSGLNRQTMTRLFDSAMRDMPLHANQDVIEAYTEWKIQVQPFLWKLWREKLAEAGLKPEQVCTRQMIFNLVIDSESNSIQLQPHYVVDSQTSVAAIDSRHPWIPLISSLYDRTETQPLTPHPTEAFSLYESWKNQAAHESKPEKATEKLRSALATDPRAVTSRLLQEFAIPRPKTDELEDLLNRVTDKVELIYSYDLAIRLWSKNAHHSAIAVLESTQERFEKLDARSPFYNLVDIPFTLAYFKAMFEFGAEMIRNMEGLLRFKLPRNPIEQEIQRLLLLAQKRDRDYVHKSFERESPVRSETWYRLQTFEFLSETERIYLNMLRSIVYLQVAERFAEGMKRFDITGESQRSIYAKIGPAIESAWAARFLESSSEELEELFNLLLGEEMK